MTIEVGDQICIAVPVPQEPPRSVDPDPKSAPGLKVEFKWGAVKASRGNEVLVNFDFGEAWIPQEWVSGQIHETKIATRAE